MTSNPNNPATSASAPASDAWGALWQTMSAPLASLIPMDKLEKIRSDYVSELTKTWSQALSTGLKVEDKRFSAPSWAANPAANFAAALYVLNAKTLQNLTENLALEPKARERLSFAVQQWTEAASPSNYLAMNPEAIAKAVETKGESLNQGIRNLLSDLSKGRMSQTDEAAFEIGKNLAITPGAVVYENEIFQLIQYQPTTPQVHARPIVMVPPCINKYYLMDLRPNNSLVRHAVAAGIPVFLVSWRNVSEEQGRMTWDDYVQEGVLRAIEVARQISGSPVVNTLGFCIGGTLLTSALALLKARGEEGVVSSITLMTSLIEFSEVGVLGIFLDESIVRWREQTLGSGGVLRGSELASVFSMLRPNDLVWSYYVGNYLKGETPPPFDLLYWNGDSTNMPGPMYCWYLRNMYLENRFPQPGGVSICGKRIDLRSINQPAYIYASREDHIVPIGGAYASTKILSGDKRLVVGASGHIAGPINPPEPKRRCYWTRDSIVQNYPATYEEWHAGTDMKEGSWWPDWYGWLEYQSGGKVDAPKQLGSAQYPVIEPAPGRYVKVSSRDLQ